MGGRAQRLVRRQAPDELPVVRPDPQGAAAREDPAPATTPARQLLLEPEGALRAPVLPVQLPAGRTGDALPQLRAPDAPLARDRAGTHPRRALRRPGVAARRRGASRADVSRAAGN